MKKIITLLLIIASMSAHAMEQNAYQNDGSEMQTYYVYGDESDSFMYDNDPSYAAQMFDWQEMQNKRAVAQWASDRIFQLEDEYDNAMDVDYSLHTQAPVQEALPLQDLPAFVSLKKSKVASTLVKEMVQPECKTDKGHDNTFKKMVALNAFEQEAVTFVKNIKKSLQSNKIKNKIVIFTCHVCKLLNPKSRKSSFLIHDNRDMNLHFKTNNHKENMQSLIDRYPDKKMVIEVAV